MPDTTPRYALDAAEAAFTAGLLGPHICSHGRVAALAAIIAKHTVGPAQMREVWTKAQNLRICLNVGMPHDQAEAALVALGKALDAAEPAPEQGEPS